MIAGVYAAHCAEILKLSDEQLAPQNGDKARKQVTGWMHKLEKVASGDLRDTHGPEDFGCFGVLNYPLPPTRADALALHSLAADSGKTAKKAPAAAN